MVDCGTICRWRTPSLAEPKGTVVGPAGTGTRNCREYKNSGNELKNLVKTKEVEFYCCAKRTQNELVFDGKRPQFAQKSELNNAPFPGSNLPEGATWGQHVQPRELPRRRGAEARKRPVFLGVCAPPGDHFDPSRHPALSCPESPLRSPDFYDPVKLSPAPFRLRPCSLHHHLKGYGDGS